LDLSSAFTKFPIFRVFRPTDESKIHAMLAETPMKVGGMELVYDRQPAFQRLLDYQAPRHVTTVADVEGDIRGFGSYSWGRRLVDGRPTTAMYIGDFRVKTDRRVAVGWRSCYPNLLRIFGTDSEFGPSEWIYTGILRDNRTARKSLVENRNANGFFYHPFAELAMVNTFFRPLRSRRNLTKGRLVSGSDVGERRLREFLVAANAPLFLGYDFSEAPGNEWDRRKATWPGFHPDRFWVWLDADDKIASCALPWSPGEAKRMRVNRLGKVATLVFRAMAALGLRAPKLGAPFSTLYLTHHVFRPDLPIHARATATSAFVDAAFRLPEISKYHMVSYADGSGLRHEPALRNLATQVTEVGLFLVTTDSSPPAIPRHEGVAFEMALV
jgi:hypothetical protein